MASRYHPSRRMNARDNSSEEKELDLPGVADGIANLPPDPDALLSADEKAAVVSRDPTRTDFYCI